MRSCAVGIPELPLSPVRLGDSDLPYGEMACICAPSGLLLSPCVRFPDRRYSSTVTPSTPGAPWFFRTRSHASGDVASGQYLFHQAARVFHSPSPFLRRSISQTASRHSDSRGCLRGFTLSSLVRSPSEFFSEGWLSSAYLRSSVPRRVPSFPFGRCRATMTSADFRLLLIASPMPTCPSGEEPFSPGKVHPGFPATLTRTPG